MKIAIIHYWLVNIRGGEKVLKALLELFPNADIFTNVYDTSSMPNYISSHNVYTTKINKLPFSKKLYKLYMPLMPKALSELNLQSYDLIISSESGPAKGIIPNPDAYHVCYCHSPMRYLWDMYYEYFRNSNFFIKLFMKRLIPSLRLWDIMSSNLVDYFIANSSYVAKRIKRYYNRDSEIIFPPVETEKYFNNERKPKDYYLFFGQITEYKRVDIAIEACMKSKRKLVIAGSGITKKILKKFNISGLITYMGKVSDSEIVTLFSECRALIFPGIEDFGIIPVEAQSAGCPVIAFNKGGICETVLDGVTGILFKEQSALSLMEALDRFELLEKQGVFNNREFFINHVKQFSTGIFKEKIIKVIENRIRN